MVDKNDISKLERNVMKDLGKAETDANKAADRESTPQRKARAFAKELRKHGVENVNETDLRKKFNS